MIALALAAVLPASGEVDLVLRPEAGTAVRYVNRIRVDSEGQSGAAFSFAMDVEQELELVFGAASADGVRTVEIRHGRVRGSFTNPMQTAVVFDSEAEEPPPSIFAAPIIAQYELLAGRTVRARVDARGRVTEVAGFVDVYRGSPVEFLFAISGYPLSEALFVDDVQVLFALLPDEPVSPGARWTTTQPADMTGVLLEFGLSSFAERVDDHEAAWSYASVGSPIVNSRRAAAQATLSPELDPLSLQSAAQGWLERGIEVTDGTLSGLTRVDASGVALEIRHEVRARGSIPHPSSAERIELSWSLVYGLVRAGAPTTESRPADRPPAPRRSDWQVDVGRLVDEAPDLGVGQTVAGAFRGDEPGLSGDPATATRYACYRVRVETAGRYAVALRSPGFAATLAVFDPLGSVRCIATDVRGAAELAFEVPDPTSVVLLLVEAATEARGPFLVELRPTNPSTHFRAPDSVTPLDGAQLLDPTALLAANPEERTRLIGYYRLFAAGIERLGGSPADHAHFHALHALACRANGEAAAARSALDAAWESFSRTDGLDVNIRFELLGIESGLARDEGRPGRALGALDEFSSLASHSSVHPLMAALLLHDQAVLLVDEFAELERASGLAREALAILAERDIDEPRIDAALRQVLALALAADDPRAAEAEVRIALANLRVAGDEESGLAAVLRGQLAGFLAARGEEIAAAREVSEALDAMVCAGGVDHETVAQLLERRAELETRSGRLGHALHAWQDALAIRVAWSGSKAPRSRSTRLALAASLARLGRTREAFEEIGRVVEDDRAQLDARIGSLSERERLAYQATQRAALDLAHELAATDPSEVRVAYDAVLLAKGAVARGLDAERARLRSANPEESARIVADLRAVEGTLAALSGSPEASAQARARRDALERELARAAPPGDTELAAQAAHVGGSLPTGGVLVDLVIHDTGVVGAASGPRVSAWITHAGARESRRVDLGPAAPIEAAVSAWRAAIDPLGARGLAATATAAVEVASPGRELVRLLVDPLRDEIEGALRILVCPDGFLAGVPFGALPSGEDGFLLEGFAIDYAHDASRMARRARARVTTNEAAFVGGLDYSSAPGGMQWTALPGALREVEALARLHREFRGEQALARVVSGADGTETRVREALQSAGTIHIATHGHVESTRSADGRAGGEARSALVCALDRDPRRADGADDGLLTAAEIAWLDMSRARLVVLSACSSGLGRAVPGEGMLGLRRAFRRAGAESVVSALWPVPDEPTAELMTDFYTRMWRDGLAPEDALRGAQLTALDAARARGEGASPLAWGAFVLE